MRLSGYTTIRNAKSMGYPFIESIKSMLSFCDEVVVLDSSDDKITSDALDELADREPKLIVIEADIDWTVPNHGIYDGQSKAMARAECTGDVLWQMDADEIVHEDHGPTIRDLAKKLFAMSTSSYPSESVPLIALPVIEFWGPDKIRTDINFWKPRLSLNDPNITHGIPGSHLKLEDGLLYAKHGTDGCDYIWKTTLEPVPVRFLSFGINRVLEKTREFMQEPSSFREGILAEALSNLIQENPGVYHYSWYSIPEKILKYKHFWNNSWKSLYNENRDPNWNPFINKSLNDMTEREIIELGTELETKTGGWIFHQKWDGSCRPSLSLEIASRYGINHPAISKEWREQVDAKKK